MAYLRSIRGAAAGSGGWLLSLLALLVLLRCLRSMLGGRCPPERWGSLELADGKRVPLEHWEFLIGADPACDLPVDAPELARNHAVLLRSDRGQWTVWDLEGELTVNGTREDEGDGIPLSEGDELRVGSWRAVFHELTQEELEEQQESVFSPSRGVGQGWTLSLLTLFQLLLMLKLAFRLGGAPGWAAARCFFALMGLQWLLYLLLRALHRKNFEPETLAFFLCTLGTAVCASASPGELGKQALVLLIGVLLFLFLGWWLRNLTRTALLRTFMGAFALALLAVNVAMGVRSYGASNWLIIDGISLQPSEFVKLAYVYVGAASLDVLCTRRNLLSFMLFSAACVLALALMGDFGTALIFFSAYLVIAFLRSGSFGALFLSIGGAGLAGGFALLVRPYIASRFSTWGHVWEDPYGAGWQQTRALAAAARGGLTGAGAARGSLRTVFAADTDLVFCLAAEELGLITALCGVLAVAALLLFAVRTARRARSSYYVIGACAAASMLTVQLALNVFGSTDLLPFTGVTFPFVSRGGSSLISCWGMLAFLKAADTRRAASFSVTLPKLRRGKDKDAAAGTEAPAAAESGAETGPAPETGTEGQA